MAEQQHEYIQDDEITLKELILKIGEFWRELWKFWWLIALITLPVLAYMMYKAITAEITYPAQLTFMVNKDEGGGMSAISGILGSFGLGGGQSGEYNLDKMLQLLKSKKITEQVIFERAEIGGREDLIANHVIHNLDTLEMWHREPSLLNRKPDKLKGFRFKNDTIQENNKLENSAVKRLQAKIIGGENTEGFLSGGYNEESGILNITAETQHEELSIVLAKTYYDKLSTFYTNQTVGGQKLTYDLLKIKSDSIYNALTDAEYRLANFVESRRSVFSEMELLTKNRLNREIQKLTILYGESAKNLELADFTLKSKTPFVTTIDVPVSPLKPNKESLFRSIIIGGFLGVFIGALFVIARKIYRDTMKES